LNPGKKPPKNTSQRQQTRSAQGSPYKSLGLDDKKQRNFHFAELFTFLIGVACTFAACYFLLIPAINSGFDTERQVAAQNLIDARAEHHENLTEERAVSEGLRDEILTLIDTIAETQGDLSEQQRINNVNRAYFLYLEDELRPALDFLEDFNGAGLPHDIRERAEMVLENGSARLGEMYFTNGQSSFAAGDTFMARQHLEYAMRFLTDPQPPVDDEIPAPVTGTPEEARRWNRMLFMLGDLYYRENLHDQAYDVLSSLYNRVPGGTLPQGANNFSGTERTRFESILTSIEGQR
jgi:hypothetical protein